MRGVIAGAIAVFVTATSHLAAAPVAGQPTTGSKPLVAASLPTGSETGQVRINVSIISYPGVPERSSCRLKFRAVNESGNRVAVSTLLKTFDTYKSDLNSWLVPTGDMAPGQAVERIYSCKSASFITLDKKSDYGWPVTCRVDGEAVSPCPVSLKVDFNLPELK
ncbi:MAG: hypothetical protein ACM33T_12135 [Solirubrobacterales bacterium]